MARRRDISFGVTRCHQTFTRKPVIDFMTSVLVRSAIKCFARISYVTGVMTSVLARPSHSGQHRHSDVSFSAAKSFVHSSHVTDIMTSIMMRPQRPRHRRRDVCFTVPLRRTVALKLSSPLLRSQNCQMLFL